jgi:hypothetical protein
MNWPSPVLLSFLLAGLATAAAEPVHEQETAAPAKPRIRLSVPEKKWLGEELCTSAPGHYSVLIWGHAEVPKAMPENFDVEEEVRHLAQHHLDWYSNVVPRDRAGAEAYRRRFEATGMRAALGFPRSDTVEQALKDGASPSNASEVKAGKKPKVAPIEPHYVAASLRVIEQQFGKDERLDWVRAVHFHDEPSGEIPYYDITPEWRAQTRARFGWDAPASAWDTNVPPSRLAYQKFWAKEYNHYQRTMADALRARHPKLPVWSANFWFNLGADLLFDYGEMGEFLDAVVVDSYATQQEINFPGRGRWNAGYTTKIAGDLSRRPVYNHIQVLEYKGATPTPADIREYASQTLRAGGRGLVYYAIDMPQYKYIRYTDPARWAEMMKIADQLHALRRLKLPAHWPTGVWVSQETLATTGPRVRNNDSYVAYVLLGETIGAPFRYISDWGVERNGASELGGVKLLYVAGAKWVPVGVREQVVRWVKAGGVLALTEADSFTQQMDGTKFENLPLGPLGKGRVLLLKPNIWRLGVWDEPARVAEVRGLQARYGGGVDEPIWRFRLPAN